MRMAAIFVILALSARSAGAVDAPLSADSPAPVAVDHLQPEAEWLRPIQAESALADREPSATGALRPAATPPPVTTGSGISGWLFVLLVAAPLLWIGLRRSRTATSTALPPGSGAHRMASSDPHSGAFSLHRAEEGGSRLRPAAGTGSGSRGSLPRAPRRDGFTLLEVMIVVAIMSTCLAAMIGQIYTLNQAQQATRQMARVQELAQVMAERIQGAAWVRLGTTSEPWSWHRRDDPAAANPPLSEFAADPNHNLATLGLIQERSGLANVRVHLEYYRNTILLGVTDNRTWATNRAVAFHRLLEDPAAFDLRNELNDIIIRVVVRWDPTPGSSQQHEIVLSRRQ